MLSMPKLLILSSLVEVIGADAVRVKLVAAVDAVRVKVVTAIDAVHVKFVNAILSCQSCHC